MASTKNEGEGNRTAARAYNKAATEFAKSGKVKAAASSAKASLKGPEAKATKAAEAVVRKAAKEEDPALRNPSKIKEKPLKH